MSDKVRYKLSWYDRVRQFIKLLLPRKPAPVDDVASTVMVVEKRAKMKKRYTQTDELKQTFVLKHYANDEDRECGVELPEHEKPVSVKFYPQTPAQVVGEHEVVITFIPQRVGIAQAELNLE